MKTFLSNILHQPEKLLSIMYLHIFMLCRHIWGTCHYLVNTTLFFLVNTCIYNVDLWKLRYRCYITNDFSTFQKNKLVKITVFHVLSYHYAVAPIFGVRVIYFG